MTVSSSSGGWGTYGQTAHTVHLEASCWRLVSGGCGPGLWFVFHSCSGLGGGHMGKLAEGERGEDRFSCEGPWGSLARAVRKILVPEKRPRVHLKTGMWPQQQVDCFMELNRKKEKRPGSCPQPSTEAWGRRTLSLRVPPPSSPTEVVLISQLHPRPWNPTSFSLWTMTR